MPIEINMIDGEACPVIRCDITGELILDASMANAIWSEEGWDPSIKDGVHKCRVFFVHKLSNRNHPINRHGTSWYNLEDFLPWMLKNINYSPDAAKQSLKTSLCDGKIETAKHPLAAKIRKARRERKKEGR